MCKFKFNSRYDSLAINDWAHILLAITGSGSFQPQKYTLELFKNDSETDGPSVRIRGQYDREDIIVYCRDENGTVLAKLCCDHCQEWFDTQFPPVSLYCNACREKDQNDYKDTVNQTYWSSR